MPTDCASDLTFNGFIWWARHSSEDAISIFPVYCAVCNSIMNKQMRNNIFELKKWYFVNCDCCLRLVELFLRVILPNIFVLSDSFGLKMVFTLKNKQHTIGNLESSIRIHYTFIHWKWQIKYFHFISHSFNIFKCHSFIHHLSYSDSVNIERKKS